MRAATTRTNATCALDLVLLTTALLLFAPLVAAQPAPDLQEAAKREEKAAQDSLARAVAEFEGPSQGRSLLAFDEIIARLEALGARALTPSGRDILAQAYEYRARVYFGIGLSEKASENFRQLVQLKPDYALSKERVSPKVVDLFNSVKPSLTGYLAVSSQPAGARVTLVGVGEVRTDLGLTDFFPVEILAGEYTVEVERELRAYSTFEASRVDMFSGYGARTTRSWAKAKDAPQPCQAFSRISQQKEQHAVLTGGRYFATRDARQIQPSADYADWPISAGFFPGG